MHLPANVPQNRLGQAAGGVAQKGQNREPVEIRHRDKVGFLQFLHRVKAAAAAERIVDAVFQHIAEFDPDVIFIQFFQECAAFFVRQPFHRFFEIFLTHLPGNRHQGQRQGICRFIQAIGVCQVGKNGGPVRLPHFPQVGVSCPFDRMGIGNVKDIPKLQPWSGIVQQRNALSAAVDPAVHLAVPQFQLRTGGCTGALGVDQKIFLERVPVQPCGGIQIPHPVAGRPADFLGVGFSQRLNGLYLCHSCLLSYAKKKSRQAILPPTGSMQGYFFWPAAFPFLLE